MKENIKTIGYVHHGATALIASIMASANLDRRAGIPVKMVEEDPYHPNRPKNWPPPPDPEVMKAKGLTLFDIEGCKIWARTEANARRNYKKKFNR